MSGDLRDRILDAAVRLLEREGPRAFRQTRVAQEAGVEQGHLTYYFPRKADLAEGVVERILERQREGAAQAVLRGDGDPRARVFGVAKSLVRDRRRTRLLLSFFVETYADEASSKKLDEAWSQQRRAFAAVVGRDEDDPQVELGLAAIRGLALGQVMAPVSSKRIDELVDQLVRWLGLHGG